MFKRIKSVNKPIMIRFEDREIEAQANDSVAAALLGGGEIGFREVSDGGAQRGPLCMIGNCFECLVEIDGQPNRQACREKVVAGMQVRMQRGLRTLGDSDEP